MPEGQQIFPVCGQKTNNFSFSGHTFSVWILSYNVKAAINNIQMSSYAFVSIKLFIKTVEDKRLVSRIYKELLKLNNQKKQTTQLKKSQNT